MARSSFKFADVATSEPTLCIGLPPAEGMMGLEHHAAPGARPNKIYRIY